MPSVHELKKLIDKISKTTDPVKIEINYGRNGEFDWKITQTNVTAEEYSPAKNNFVKLNSR